MKKIRELLVGAPGWLGVTLWFLFPALFLIFPLYILHWHGILSFICIVVISSFPIAGDILRFSIYIEALVVTVQGPQDWIAIAYYVFFAVELAYFLFRVISFAIYTIQYKKENPRYKGHGYDQD